LKNLPKYGSIFIGILEGILNFCTSRIVIITKVQKENKYRRCVMKNGNIKRMLVFMTAIIFFGLVSLVINGECVSAGDTTTVSVEGYLDYERAFEVLELLNESRREAGL